MPKDLVYYKGEILKKEEVDVLNEIESLESKFERSRNKIVITSENNRVKSLKIWDSIYSLFSISVSGVIKKVTEKKLRNIIWQSFIQKYSGQLIDSESKSKSISRLVVLDTEEMTATEEIGS